RGAELLGADEATERDATADRLRERDDVGLDTVMLMREVVTGTAESGEDLVHDERDPVPLADRLHFRPIVVRWNDHATHAKDRLGDHHRRFARYTRMKHVLDDIGARSAALARLELQR